MDEEGGNNSDHLETVEKATASLKVEIQSDEAAKVKNKEGSSSEKSVSGKFLRRNHKYHHNVSLFEKSDQENTNNSDCKDQKGFDFGTLVDFVIVDEVEDENEDDHSIKTCMDAKVAEKVKLSICSREHQQPETFNEDDVADVYENFGITETIHSNNEYREDNCHADGSQQEQNMVVLDNLDLEDEGDEFYLEVKNLSETKRNHTLEKKADGHESEKTPRKRREGLSKIKVSIKETSESSSMKLQDFLSLEKKNLSTLKEKKSSQLKERKSSPLKEKKSSPLKEKKSSPLKEKKSSPLKEKKSSSGHVCRIPGLSFIIGIKPDEHFDLKKNRYDCVLCSSKEEKFEVLFSGSEMKSHAQSRRHIFNVMRIWNHDFYQKYLRNNASSWITTSKLLDELLNYEATKENQKIVVATKKTYAQQRESVNLKIKNLLLDIDKASSIEKVACISPRSKKSTAIQNKIVASPIISNDSVKESKANQNNFIVSPVSSNDSAKESILNWKKYVTSPHSPVSSNDSAKDRIAIQNKIFASPVSSDDSAKDSIAIQTKIVASPVSSYDSSKDSIAIQNNIVASPVSSDDSTKECIANQNNIVASPVSSDDSAKVSIVMDGKIIVSSICSIESTKESSANANKCKVVASPISSEDDLLAKKHFPTSNEHRKMEKEVADEQKLNESDLVVSAVPSTSKATFHERQAKSLITTSTKLKEKEVADEQKINKSDMVVSAVPSISKATFHGRQANTLITTSTKLKKKK